MRHNVSQYLLIALFSVVCLLSSLGLEYKTAIADHPQQVLNPETGNPLYGGDEFYQGDISTPANFYRLNGIPNQTFTIDSAQERGGEEEVYTYDRLWHRGGEEQPDEGSMAILRPGDSFTLTGKGYYLFQSSGFNDGGGAQKYAFEMDNGRWINLKQGEMFVTEQDSERSGDLTVTEDFGISYDSNELAHDHLHEEPPSEVDPYTKGLRASIGIETSNYYVSIPGETTVTSEYTNLYQDIDWAQVWKNNQLLSAELIEMSDTVKALKFRTNDDETLSFSQDIDISINVGESYNGQTLTIQREPERGDDFISNGQCTVTSDSWCNFTADETGLFMVTEEELVDSDSGLSPNQAEDQVDIFTTSQSTPNEVVNLDNDVHWEVTDNGTKSSSGKAIQNSDSQDQVTILPETEITSSSPNIQDKELEIQPVEDETVQENSAVKAIKFGVSGETLEFSTPVEITIKVGEGQSGNTMSVHRKPEGRSEYNQEGLVDKTCIVSSSGECSFSTRKASVFAVVEAEGKEVNQADCRPEDGNIWAERADIDVPKDPQCYALASEVDCIVSGNHLDQGRDFGKEDSQRCVEISANQFRPVEAIEANPPPSPPSSENLIFSWSGGDAFFGLISANDVENDEVPSVVVETEEISVGDETLVTPTDTVTNDKGMRVLADPDNPNQPAINPDSAEFPDVSFTKVKSASGQNTDQIIEDGEGETIQGDQDGDGNIVREENGGQDPPIQDPEDPPNGGGGNLDDGAVAEGLTGWSDALGDDVLRMDDGGIIGFIAELIRWALGLLGTIFFVITLAAGFMYMTAGGDTQKVSSAIGLVKNAIVGLVIIAGSYLITEYVISAVLN